MISLLLESRLNLLDDGFQLAQVEVYAQHIGNGDHKGVGLGDGFVLAFGRQVAEVGETLVDGFGGTAGDTQLKALVTRDEVYHGGLFGHVEGVFAAYIAVATLALSVALAALHAVAQGLTDLCCRRCAGETVLSHIDTARQ